MDVDETLVLNTINPNNFPAKLWRLVNDPSSGAARWDSGGEGLIIHQRLFEADFLCPNKNTVENAELFKTTNFTSFIRQLNLYGFKKVIIPGNTNKASGRNYATGETGIRHHFHNPNFKRNHPELLLNLKRLTTSNKAKVEAGVAVNCRPPIRCRRSLANDDNDKNDKTEKIGGSSFYGQTHRATSGPYHPNRSQPIKEYNRILMPPRRWMMGHGDAPSPTTFYTEHGIPVSVIQCYPGEASRPTTVHTQQGLQVCQCCSPGSVASGITGSSHQTASYSHMDYYQPSCPVRFLYPGNDNQDSHNCEKPEMEKSDINLDTVFQIVDELQDCPKICMVKVGTPEKQVPVAERSTIYSPTLPVSLQSDTSEDRIKRVIVRH
ncbi:heat shock factor protein 5 [Polymixia lowei]